MSLDIHKVKTDAHKALCVYVTEKRLFELDAGDPGGLHFSLPAAESVSDDWIKFVTKCRTAGIDPMSFIRRVFACQPSDIQPPMVRQIVRAEVVSQYKLLGKRIVDELSTMLESQTQLINRHMALGLQRSQDATEVVRAIAADPFVPLHPAIRLILAVRSGLLCTWKLEEPLVAEAVLSYGKTPDLFDQAWGQQCIYSELKKRAPQDYDRLLGLEA